MSCFPAKPTSLLYLRFSSRRRPKWIFENVFCRRWTIRKSWPHSIDKKIRRGRKQSLSPFLQRATLTCSTNRGAIQLRATWRSSTQISGGGSVLCDHDARRGTHARMDPRRDERDAYLATFSSLPSFGPSFSPTSSLPRARRRLSVLRLAHERAYTIGCRCIDRSWIASRTAYDRSCCVELCVASTRPSLVSP